MATIKTYIIQLHNQNDWNEDYTKEDVKSTIEGYNCSPECESMTFIVDYIKEFTND